MRFPFATSLLFVLVLAPYFFFSSNAFYLTDSFLNQYSAASGNLLGLAAYLFLHVGLIHLIANALPLVLFAFLLETVLPAASVVLVFLVSGVVSGAFFSVLNPTNSLVGASAGIAGLMAAASVLKPKYALALLVLTPVLTSFVLIPTVTVFSQQYAQGLEAQKTVLAQNVSQLVVEKKFAEAAAANETLQSVSSTFTQVSEGRKREASAKTDLLVHAVGALVGLAYVFLFARPALAKGVKEFKELGSLMHLLELKLKNRLKRKR